MREKVLTPRRALVIGVMGGAAALLLRRPAVGQPAQPDRAVRLFRIISPRDTVMAGVTAAELARWGEGDAVTLLAERLVAMGQVTLHAYAVGRGADGALRMVPRGRIAVLRSDTLRIEPYTPTYPVTAPAA